MTPLERFHKPPKVIAFSRHSGGCKSKTEACDCPKWLRYSIEGKQVREAANTRSMTEARERAADRQKQLDGTAHAPEPTVARDTISEAVRLFILSKEGEGCGPSTLRKHRHHTGSFETWIVGRGVRYTQDLTPQHLLEYRATWTWASGLTRQKTQQNIKTFLRFACHGEHLHRLLAAFKTQKLSGEDRRRTAPRPFSEDELSRLIAQVPVSFPEPLKAARMIGMIHFMASTGTAIRDTVQLERKHLEGGWLKFRRQKMLTRAKGGHVLQRLDPALYSELTTLLNGNPKYIFWEGQNLPESEVNVWQTDFRRLMQDAGCYVEGTTTHRFRDTFVDWCLANDWDPHRIAAAIGDILSTLETHYASLISDRQRDKMSKLPVRSW